LSSLKIINIILQVQIFNKCIGEMCKQPNFLCNMFLLNAAVIKDQIYLSVLQKQESRLKW
jgi:hypothetical protein